VARDLVRMQQPKMPKIAAVSTKDHAQSGSTIDKFKANKVFFFKKKCLTLIHLSVPHLVTLSAPRSPAHSCVHASGCRPMKS
jgi:hypothetical protein